MQITENQVLDALKNVQDPDLKRDVVSLGMIQHIQINGNRIAFTFVLTTPACPMKNLLKQNCINAIHEHIDPGAEVDIEFGSRVTTGHIEKKELLPGVRNVIAVASGKGGVGKSTVAANLAIALSKTGAEVGLMDADIYGPSVPMMFDVVNERPFILEENGKFRIQPLIKYGIKLLSIGFFVDPAKALVWRGPMASNALLQLFGDADWGELDYLIVDLPPGTGDIHLTLAQQVPVTGIAIVSTPQEIALADARKAISMFSQEGIRIPVLGLIENMSWFTPAELPDNKYYIFGKEGGKKLAGEFGIPFLGEIPLVQSVCQSGDKGIPAAMEDESPVSLAFDRLAENIAQQISIINAAMQEEKFKTI